MDVSVVIVSYNVSGFLKDCLASVLKFTSGVKFEVIVVDNASLDDSVAVVKSFGNRVRLIEAGENGGFAKGNNLGIKQAKGKYVLLLNPDTVFKENSLLPMVKWMEEHPNVAVGSCQILDFEEKICPTGGYFPTLERMAAWALFLDDLPFLSGLIKSYHPQQAPTFRKKELYGKEFFPDWLTGAFFMVRKEATEKVGNLDETFFMYGEELEWCMRFVQAGWKVGYTPVTKIVHFERKSSGGGSRNAVLGEFRGLKYIYQKHFPGWRQAALDFFLDLAAIGRMIFWTGRRNGEMVRVYWEALWL